MACAKKCDRCGNYYDENKHERFIFGYRVKKITLGTNDKMLYRDFDLCDDCFDAFYKFMGIKED